MSQKLEEALKQIKAVCEDNGKPGCEHRLALDFIWRVADAALTRPACVLPGTLYP